MKNKKTPLIIGIILLIAILSVAAFYMIDGSQTTQALISTQGTISACENKVQTNALGKDQCIGCAEIDNNFLSCIQNRAAQVGVSDNSRINKYSSNDLGDYAYVCYNNDEAADNSDGDKALRIVSDCISYNIFSGGSSGNGGNGGGETGGNGGGETGGGLNWEITIAIIGIVVVIILSITLYFYRKIKK